MVNKEIGYSTTENPMHSLTAQKLTEVVYELETTAIRIEAQREAPIEVVHELYRMVRDLREVVLDIESYGKRDHNDGTRDS